MSIMTDLMRMDGRAVLVTGGGGGIGAAVCELLADAGARVALCDIDLAAARATAARLPGASAHQCDIADETSVEALFAAVLAEFGRLDAMIHVAAIFPKLPLLRLTAADWDAVHAVNVRGTFLVVREAIRAMQEAGRGGAIVNVSSVSAARPVLLHNIAYGASKAAVSNLTQSVALEAAAHGIRVNAVLPGATETEGGARMARRMEELGVERAGPILQPGRIPLGRLAQPREIASACLFLASDAAGMITGQLLAVDGGFLLS